MGIAWIVAMCSDRLPERNLLAQPLQSAAEGQRLIGIARRELGVKEATGHNDGKEVEAYLQAVGMVKGQPYCAAFVSWVFKKAGYRKPRSAWSPALFPAKLQVRSPAPGHVFGIYFPELKRIAHCGLVSQVKGDWIGTIEANTNLPGSREGDGVYARTRHFRTIRCYANWTGKGGLP